MTSYQTVTLSMSDNVGLAGYYWGTSSTYSNNSYTTISGTNQAVNKTVSSSGIYYLTVKDASGNVSSTASKAFYKTSFNANGGTISPLNVLTMYGYSLILPTPSKSGYSFNNWTTNVDGSGTSYSAGDCYVVRSNVTLYAQWSQNPYTLKYNANGGNGAPNAQTGNGDITISFSAPTRKGYTFLGWATVADARTAQYQPGATFNLTNNTTLFAVWEKKDSSDNLDSPANPTENAKISVKSDEVYKNSKVTVIAKASNVPTGYVLAIYDGGSTPVATGDNKSVTYELPELVAKDKSLTVKIIDADKKVQKDGDGKDLTAKIEIKVKTGFFDLIIAFFRKLFNANTVTIEP